MTDQVSQVRTVVALSFVQRMHRRRR